MSAQKLTDLMVSAGVSHEEAQKRADAYVADRQAEEKLSKSLSVLEEIATIQRETEAKQEQRLEKAMSKGQTDIVNLIAPALDDLLKEQRAQNNALAKGLTGVLEIMKSFKEDLASLRDNQRPIKTPLSKSIDFVPSPLDETAPTTRDDLFKALSQTVADHPDRAGELLKAVTLLESGANPEEVSKQFNLKG
jgi:hypothetical protein